MTYNEETKTLTADSGKVLRRIEDGNIYGESIALGYSYYIGGKKLDTPHLDVPSDFEEVDNPYKEEVVPTTLEDAKEQVKKKIEEYDSSDAVNSFTVNGETAWMTATERTNYTASIQSAETLGETSVDLILNGNKLTLPIENAKTLLAQICRYADKCWMITQKHISEVNSLNDITSVMEYDYKKEYPNKLQFNI